MKCAVFLDRDNTILSNDGDLGDPSLVKIIAGAAWGIRALCEGGYTIVVVTNQGGVARGKYSPSDVDAVHARTAELLTREAEWTRNEPLVTKWMSCPYHPEGTIPEFRREHPWRKPAPGMLVDAASELSIDLSRSWMVGDQERDVEAGKNAGCRTIRLLQPSQSHSAAKAESGADFVESDLLHASHRILRTDGHDGAPVWTATSSTRIAAAPGRLDERETRRAVEVAAIALAQSAGIRIARLVVDESGVEIEVLANEFVAVGLAAELRRNTNRWAAARGAPQLWVAG